MKNKYRIREFCNEFTIQVLDKNRWYNCDFNGNRCSNPRKLLTSFETKEAANTMINGFKRGVVFHDVD